MKDYTEFPLEINAERLMQLPAGSYLAADMRDEYSCGYGMMDGAVRPAFRFVLCRALAAESV